MDTPRQQRISVAGDTRPDLVIGSDARPLAVGSESESASCSNRDQLKLVLLASCAATSDSEKTQLRRIELITLAQLNLQLEA
jgi:hypothetical protein